MNSLKFYAIVLVVFPIYGIQSEMLLSKKGVSYYVDKITKVNWYTAHVECSTRGMALVTVEDKEQNDDIVDVAGTDEADEATFLWVGGVGQEDSTAWISTGRPLKPSVRCTAGAGCTAADNTAENCFTIGAIKALNSIACTQLRGFICEKRGEDCCKNKPNILLNLSQKAK